MNNFTHQRTSIAAAIGLALACHSVQASSTDYLNTKLMPKEQRVTASIGESHTSSWIVQLSSPSLSDAYQVLSTSNGVSQLSRQTVTQIEQSITSTQSKVAEVISNLSNVKIVGKTSKLVNALIVEGDASEVYKLSKNPLVISINPDQSSTTFVDASAEYVNATEFTNTTGFTGKGVKVAVIDSGIDYTHKAFKGSGDPQAYVQAIEDLHDQPTWPQGQVIGGYDFVDDDPDPIDQTIDTPLGAHFETHGTEVSNSVTGVSPDVELYVYRVCTRNAQKQSSCADSRVIQAFERAMDPNNDGDLSDRVDTINISIGGSFGASNNYLTPYVEKASKLGVNVVIAAGNDGRSPFIVGGPSTAPSALSVGGTAHPVAPSFSHIHSFKDAKPFYSNSNFDYDIDNDSAPLVYPSVNQRACEPFNESVDFTAKAVLVDRGDCNFVDKIKHIQNKGGTFAIIANNVPNSPLFNNHFNDPEITIPTVFVSYEEGVRLKEEILEGQANYSVKSKAVVNRKNAIYRSSSRGPAVDGLLKPEIVAPAVDVVTASASTGDKTTTSTGTSFASPILAGAISLLKEMFPHRTSSEIKAMIMNSADLNITLEGVEEVESPTLAPISQIGSGLLDVAKAGSLNAIAWASDTKQAALSFGSISLDSTKELTKSVTVKNFSSEAQTYQLTLAQRFSNDEKNGALSFNYPESITVPAGATERFEFSITIDPEKLRKWTLTQENATNPGAALLLTELEYDGALNFMQGGDKALHLVYHILPKAKASLEIQPEKTDSGAKHKLINSGADDFEFVDFIELSVVDEAEPAKLGDIVAGDMRLYPVDDSICESGYSIKTSFITSVPLFHGYQHGLAADIDFNRDGIWDLTTQTANEGWFDGGTAGQTISFTHIYGSGFGGLGDAIYSSGGNMMTTLACLGDFGLTPEEIDSTSAIVRFRSEHMMWQPIAKNSIDSMTTQINFDLSSSDHSLPSLVDESGQKVSRLDRGKKAYLSETPTRNTAMVSNYGARIISYSSELVNSAPKVVVGQEFAVDENAENGTVIGRVKAEYQHELAKPVSEFAIIESSSSALRLTAEGQLVVQDSALLDYDTGVTSVELHIVATDMAGNISDSELVKVNINNLVDESSEEPQTLVKSTIPKGSSGSLAWLSLFVASIVATRRRFKS